MLRHALARLVQQVTDGQSRGGSMDAVAEKVGSEFGAGRDGAALGPGALPSFLKRSADIGAALALLVFCLPMLLSIAVAIKVQDGGPVLFRHRRCGRGGAMFGLWKFRTMRIDAAERLNELLQDDQNAEAEWLRTRKLRRDPRVTRLGKFLRKTSLDELPQLVNILRGDMSVIGPRPVMKEELDGYRAARCYYEAMRPGVTGLWQVSGRNALSFQARVALDTAYVRDWSLRKDAIILLRTVPVVLTARGAY